MTRPVTCAGSQGTCARPAACFVFGHLPAHPWAEGRVTVVAGPRGRRLAEQQPDGARCVDCARAELEALTHACRPVVRDLAGAR